MKCRDCGRELAGGTCVNCRSNPARAGKHYCEGCLEVAKMNVKHFTDVLQPGNIETQSFREKAEYILAGSVNTVDDRVQPRDAYCKQCLAKKSASCLAGQQPDRHLMSKEELERIKRDGAEGRLLKGIKDILGNR